MDPSGRLSRSTLPLCISDLLSEFEVLVRIAEPPEALPDQGDPQGYEEFVRDVIETVAGELLEAHGHGGEEQVQVVWKAQVRPDLMQSFLSEFESRGIRWVSIEVTKYRQAGGDEIDLLPLLGTIHPALPAGASIGLVADVFIKVDAARSRLEREGEGDSMLSPI